MRWFSVTQGRCNSSHWVLLDCRSYRKPFREGQRQCHRSSPFSCPWLWFFSGRNHWDAGRHPGYGVLEVGTGDSRDSGGQGCPSSAVPRSIGPSLHSVWATWLHGCCRILYGVIWRFSGEFFNSVLRVVKKQIWICSPSVCRTWCCNLRSRVIY